VALLQLESDVVDAQFAADTGHAVLGVEICEMRKLTRELMAQARVGEDLPVTVAFAALKECDQRMLVVHGRSVARNSAMVASSMVASHFGLTKRGDREMGDILTRPKHE
jgi:hypothetical protein